MCYIYIYMLNSGLYICYIYVLKYVLKLRHMFVRTAAIHLTFENNTASCALFQKPNIHRHFKVYTHLKFLEYSPIYIIS